MSKLFVPVLSLQGCPSKRHRGILGCVPKPCWQKKNSLMLSQTFLLRHAIGSSYPYCTMLDKGVLEVLLPCLPGLYLNWGSDPPSGSIKVSIVLLFPGIWSQTSARAQSPFFGNHSNTNSCICPPPTFQSGKLGYYLPRINNVWLKLQHTHLRLRSWALTLFCVLL